MSISFDKFCCIILISDNWEGSHCQSIIPDRDSATIVRTIEPFNCLFCAVRFEGCALCNLASWMFQLCDYIAFQAQIHKQNETLLNDRIFEINVKLKYNNNFANFNEITEFSPVNFPCKFILDKNSPIIFKNFQLKKYMHV